MDDRGVIVDLDGTVYRGNTPIPGAAETIATLRERDVSIIFLTNNPVLSPESLSERLTAMGVAAAPEEVISAGAVTARYLAENHPDQPVLVVGSSGLCEQLTDAGLSLTDDPVAASVVVTSYNPEFGYEDLTAGLQALDDAALFLGTDPDRVYPGDDGQPIPGSGAITNAVAGVANREPDLVLGKPAFETVETVLDSLEHPPSTYLVVGDSPETDIAFGQRAGMDTALVRSGLTETPESTAFQPDHVVDSLADVVSIL